MRFIKLVLFALIIVPFSAFSAENASFVNATKLLTAARRGDTQTIQMLLNSGVDINYVDSTGLSLVCTAIMNNDMKSAQILQMYGADASRCSSQIKTYKTKIVSKGSKNTGVFSRLGTPQILTLSAAGVAGVVGGLFAFTDVFDPDNGNDSGISSGSRGEGGGGSSSSKSSTWFSTVYGPKMPDASSENSNYISNLNYYSDDTTTEEYSIVYKDFDLLTNVYNQNYLLMMHGYSPLARGYLGMKTLRNKKNEPISLQNVKLENEEVMGGQPINVAMITKNGINIEEGSSLKDRLLLWTTIKDGNSEINSPTNNMLSSKYYNNIINFGGNTNSITDDASYEDKDIVSKMDLSGFGTAVNNINANFSDNLLVKILNGRDSDSDNTDYVGFMPNGQVSVYRVGGGTNGGMVTLSNPITNAGSYVKENGVLKTVTIGGKSYNIVVDGKNLKFCDAQACSYYGYFGADSLLYVNNNGNSGLYNAYELSNDGMLLLTKQQGTTDYKNYTALYDALLKSSKISTVHNNVTSRSPVSVIANAFVLPELSQRTTETVDNILNTVTDNQKTTFLNLIQKYYNQTDNDNTLIKASSSADNFFDTLGRSYSAITVFSTGKSLNDSNFAGLVQNATFENAAPIVYPNIEHLFMSVVAVGVQGGTSGTDNISKYDPSKIQLSQWVDKNGTEQDSSDDKYYQSRICGVAGTGTSSLDPWCFAAAGVTDERAVSAAAGAVGILMSAFPYMTDKQIFSLLALTADGPFLGTDTDGTAYSTESLKTYLNNKYILPVYYQTKIANGMDYLDAFKEVYGYGLINLERATTPGKTIYTYDTTNHKIVSSSGDAYWRSAINTAFKPSSALGGRKSSVKVSYYDILSSVDSSISLPRVWTNEFNIGDVDKSGLYMGDVLGDFNVSSQHIDPVTIGNLTLNMKFSPRAYNDNKNGLDKLKISLMRDNFNFAVGYQHHFTNDNSRFDGRTNSVLALTSNAIVSDISYNQGHWSLIGNAFSGSVTEEGLLENDPVASSQFEPARLGYISGGSFGVGYKTDALMLNMSVGIVHETDTLLGSYTDGLLSLGNGNTTYIDLLTSYSPIKDVVFSLRTTFADTKSSNISGEFINDVSKIRSNSFALGADIGNLSFTVAAPLATTYGNMKYSYTDFDIIDNSDGDFGLVVNNPHIETVDLTPEKREIRFSTSYKHPIGKFTDAGCGFIYRIHPNNTIDFGNESIFMLKVQHRLGI